MWAARLDRTKEEVLIVNTRELDCTTYVEMVTALTLCAREERDFFLGFLRTSPKCALCGRERFPM